jgi:hypothetical protein
MMEWREILNNRLLIRRTIERDSSGLRNRTNNNYPIRGKKERELRLGKSQWRG